MLKYKFDRIYPTILRYVLDKRGWIRAKAEDQDWNLYWRNGRFSLQEVTNALPHQHFNHFINSGMITRKAGTTHYLKQMRKIYGEIYDFILPSFVLNKRNLDEIAIRLNEETNSRLWIVKPSNGSQGKGIQLVSNLKDIQLVDPERIYVAQLYIPNPWLISGYKFDIRIYVLVTSFHPMTIYLYKEGLVRFATKKFELNSQHVDLKSFEEKYRHLTNTSINKYSPIFFSNSNNLLVSGTQHLKDNSGAHLGSPSVEFDKEITQALGLGSSFRRTLRQLVGYMHRQDMDYRSIWEQIKKIVILTLLPLAEHVPKTHTRCFELYGFDIMLDSSLKPWLIEVNFSPSLGGNSITDQSIKEGLLEDVIDVLNIRPAKADPASPNFEKEKYIEEFYDFLARGPSRREECANASFSQARGNFEMIFPFNRETLEISSDYEEPERIREQREAIINQVQKKYIAPFRKNN